MLDIQNLNMSYGQSQILNEMFLRAKATYFGVAVASKTGDKKSMML